jgi:hypothetical protein
MRLVRPVNGNTVCRDEGALDGFVGWVDTVNGRSVLPSWIGWPPASTTVAETPPLPSVIEASTVIRYRNVSRVSRES